MTPPSEGSRRQAGGAAVFIILCLLLLPWLGLTLFNSKGEPREAIVAVSILESGNWILPVNYGGDIPYKPPFMAWVIAVLSYVFNGGIVTEYLSRLPSALASIALGTGGYYWASRLKGTRFGVVFALTGVTCFEVFRASVACRLDMVLTACMVGAIYLMFNARELPGGRRATALRYAGAWALLTCATLTKGPVGALLPCAAMGAYRLLRGDRFLPAFFGMLGLALAALAVPALWYVKAYELGGEEFYNLAWEENIGRLTGTMSYDSHVKPFWYNFVTMAAGLLPWTLLLLGALFYRPWRGFRAKIKTISPGALLALVAGSVIFIFYCIPESKRSVYLLPVYPFACYGVTVLVLRYEGKKLMRGLATGLGALAVAVPPLFLAASASGRLPLEVAPAWAWVLALVPMGVGVAVLRKKMRTPLGSVLAACALYFFYLSTAMPSVLNPRSDIHAAPEILAMNPEGGRIIYTLGHGPGERLYTLNFYLGDCLRALPSEEALDTLEPGRTVLLLSPTDTTALRERGIEPQLFLRRSCDHRRPLWGGRK